MSLVESTANITDLNFIYSCMLYGARKGHYSFDAENPEMVGWMKKEIQCVVARQILLDQRHAVASVFKFRNKRIATLIMSEAFLNSNSIEIYALSVEKKYQGQGHGRTILDDVLDRHQHTDIYARCSPASEKMTGLLKNRNFILHSIEGEFNVLVKSANDFSSIATPSRQHQ